MVWTVILAAGESKRMGQPKLLLPWENSTILETVVWKALSTRSDGILVVLGADREKIGDLIKKAPVKTVYNQHYKEGMLSSVRAGLTALPSGTRAAIFALGDQPLIPPEAFDLLLDSFAASEKGIILPTFRGKRGHPLLVDMKYKDEILGLDDRIGLRGLLQAHPGEILEVPINDPGILKDIDSPDEYRALLAESRSNTPDEEDGGD
jgi:molybdenum cofactor cytidylyltransferase